MNVFFKPLGSDLKIVPYLLYVGVSVLATISLAVSVLKKSVPTWTKRSEERLGAWLIVLALLLFILARWVAITSIPIFSDMLPAIQMGVQGWLSGQNLYAIHCLPSHCLPAPYFPLTEIAHVPLALLNADFRWLSILGVFGVVFVALGVSRRPSIGLSTVLACFTLSPLLIERHELYLAPFWTLLALFGAALVTRRWVLASVALGLLLGTHQMAVLLLPFYAILVWRNKGIKSAVMYSGLSAAIGALILLLFFLPDPPKFLYALWGRGSRKLLSLSGPLVWTTSGVMGVSIAPFLFALIGTVQTYILTIFLYLMVVLFALRRLQHPADALIWATIGLVVPLLSLYVSPAYLYVGAFIMLVFAAIAKECDVRRDLSA